MARKLPNTHKTIGPQSRQDDRWCVHFPEGVTILPKSESPSLLIGNGVISDIKAPYKSNGSVGIPTVLASVLLMGRTDVAKGGTDSV